jgi:hypothetical protein
MSSLDRSATVPESEHVEVTLDDLFIEHYDPPAVPPKVSSAMKAARRRVPHHKSLLGLVMLGGLIAGAGFLSYRRWIA